MSTTRPRTTVLARLAKLISGRPGASPTAAELEESLDEAQALLPDLHAELEAAQVGRRDALLAGDATAVATHEARIAEIRLEMERLDLLVERVPEQLERARAAELESAREARSRELEALQARGRAILRRYGKLAAELVPLLTELESIDTTLAAARTREPDLPRHPTPPTAERTTTVTSIAAAAVIPPAEEGGPSWLGRSPTVEIESPETRRARLDGIDQEFRRRRERAVPDPARDGGEVIVDDGFGKVIGPVHDRHVRFN